MVFIVYPLPWLIQVKSAVWSPFYLSLVESLVNRNGVLNFFHDHLRQAVENRYLVTNEAKQECYLRLANFFSSKPLDNRTVSGLYVNQSVCIECIFYDMFIEGDSQPS